MARSVVRLSGRPTACGGRLPVYQDPCSTNLRPAVRLKCCAVPNWHHSRRCRTCCARRCTQGLWLVTLLLQGVCGKDRIFLLICATRLTRTIWRCLGRLRRRRCSVYKASHERWPGRAVGVWTPGKRSQGAAVHRHKPVQVSRAKRSTQLGS